MAITVTPTLSLWKLAAHLRLSWFIHSEPNQSDHVYDEVIMDSVDVVAINEFLYGHVALELPDKRMPTLQRDPAPTNAPDAILDSQKTIIEKLFAIKKYFSLLLLLFWLARLNGQEWSSLVFD